MAPAIKAIMPRARSAPITRLRFSGLIIFPSSRLRHATFVRHYQDANDGCIEGSTCRACPGLALPASAPISYFAYALPIASPPSTAPFRICISLRELRVFAKRTSFVANYRELFPARVEVALRAVL